MYKENINIPKASLFIVNRIKQRLADKKWDKTSNTNQVVVVISKEFSYSSEVIRPIERLFSKDGWKFRMTNYSKNENIFSYTFQMVKERKNV